MVIVVTGVSGAGKSAVGHALASELGWIFLEGDDFHPARNVEKMRRGEPLTDEDRVPWLVRLRDEIAEHLERGKNVVLTCSALKKSYRDILRVDANRVRFVFLHGDRELIRERIDQRDGHFMGSAMLDSQFATLEPPERALTLDVTLPVAELVSRIRDSLVDDPVPETSILLEGLAFPEAPRWRDGRLWFTDQHARRVRWVEPDGRSEVVAELDDLPGGLGWLPDGTMLVVAMTSRRIYRMLDDGSAALHADVASLARFHLNDMLVDRVGRAWVGNFGYDLHGGEPPTPTELIVVEPDGTPRVAARDLVFPNGMVLTPDERSLIVAETFAHRLTRFELEDDGRLRRRRVWADLGDATPDGICLEADGAIWLACPGTGSLLRVREGGEITRRIRPHGTPYACMLGGESGTTLFVLTSETDDPGRAVQLRSGRIETIEVDPPSP